MGGIIQGYFRGIPIKRLMVDFDRGLRDDGVGAYSFWKPYPGGTIITYKAVLENGETIEGKMSKSQFEKEYRGET